MSAAPMYTAGALWSGQLENQTLRLWLSQLPPPHLLSPKMDVYSFGVFVDEMFQNRPARTVKEQRKQLDEVKWPAMKGITLW